MNVIKTSLAITALCTVALGGCATVFKSKTSSVAVSSATPGAQVTVDGKPAGVTPTNVEVANQKDAVIIVSANGKQETCQMRTGAATGWVVADIFLTSGLGLIIDWVTHNWNDVEPNACHVGV